MRLIKYLPAFLFIVTAFPFAVESQKLLSHEPVLARLPENLGLSQSSINDIIQDSDGYLWVATWSGLIRYDGYTTKVFHSGNGEFDLKGNLISCLFEDHEGNLWVGTQASGLYRFNKRTNQFVNYQHDPNSASISNNNIWRITEDDKNNLWIGTEDGLNYFDRSKNEFVIYRHSTEDSTSISDNFVTDILIASDGSVWIATNFGLNKLVQSKKRNSFVHFVYPSEEAAHNFVYQVREIKNKAASEMWFITKKGLKRLAGGTITGFIAEDKSPNFSLYRSMLVLDEEQNTFLLGSALGLSRFEVSSLSYQNDILKPQDSNEIDAEPMAVTALYIDRGGVLWVGTKKGLYRDNTSRKNFELFLTAEFDPSNSIITGIRSATSGYWVSTIGGGLFHFDGKRFRHFNIKADEKNDFVPFIQCLYTDRKGNVWIGTAGAGVLVANPHGGANANLLSLIQHYHTSSPKAIPDDYIVSFAEDKNGSMWIGTWNGNLIEVSSDGQVIAEPANKFNGLPLVTLYADSSGIWAGSRGAGIFYVQKGNHGLDIRQYAHIPSQPQSLNNNFVTAIYEGQNGNLWIASEGGLTRLDRHTKTFKELPIKNGPANKVIVGVLEDNNGKLWLSHWDGLTLIDPSKASQRDPRNFDGHDLVQGGFFYNNVCFKDSKGNLLFGGSNGLNVVHPDNVNESTLRPNVLLTDLRLFNQIVSVGEEIDGRVILDQSLDQSDKIELAYDQNTISFEFAALDFSAPEKIRYAYMLEGVDKDWNYTGASRRFANYTNLNDGDYLFRVRSTNADGVWSQNETNLKIVLLPPWWKTNVAVVSYVILSVLLLYLFRKLILLRANFIHDLKLERVQRENMEQLNSAKLQFFTNISHELRTPLTLILGPLQSLIDAGSTNKLVSDQLHIINNNAQRLLRLVNQLLDFRKAESGNLKLRVSEGDIVWFAKEIKLSFDALAAQMKIDFKFLSATGKINLFFDRDQFEKILFNLLSNAFRHTPEGGQVSIDICETEDAVILEVCNTGKGIKPEHFDKIFQSFFSYDEEKHAAGTGIGLALVKSLVDAHRGHVDVKSIHGQETKFRVTLKKGATHFESDEIVTEHSEEENISSYPLLNSEPMMKAQRIEQCESQTDADKSSVLIIEDNDDVRNYVRSIFSGDYNVFEARDGQEGLTIANDQSPDIIVSDIMMPVMDGIKLCTELKQNLKTSHIPVILLTARTSLIFKVEGLETGADDYVNKPFNPTVLRLKVRNLLRTRAMIRQAFSDNAVLNIEPKRVTLNSTDERFIQQALASIERHMSNPEYHVEMLGDDVAMSRMQLYRKLKAITGQSAVEFIRTIRMKRAAQLLEQGELSVSQITYEVGFNDLQYFRECFKKQFGMTPTDYAQRAVNKVSTNQ